MSIMVLLATLAITAFQGTDGDRVINGASNFKNALEGAKSRALKANQSRGLRLIPDDTYPYMITSMVYIDGGSFHSGKDLHVAYDNRLPGDPGYNALSAKKWRLFVEESLVPNGTWNRLINQKLLQAGCKIQIPAGDGNWFTLVDRAADSPNAWIIEEHFSPSDSIPTNPVTSPEEDRGGYRPLPNTLPSHAGAFGISTAVPSDALSYLIQLVPAILPGSQPISLLPGACIDLDGSKIPVSWRPTTDKPYYGPINGSMDILFTSRATIGRPLTSEGILHFRIASASDVIAGRQTIEPLLPFSKPVVTTDPEIPAKLVSLITQTGMIINADINTTGDTDTIYNNELYNFNDPVHATNQTQNPYRYILHGKESSQ